MKRNSVEGSDLTALPPAAPPAQAFPPTRWSVVLAAQQVPSPAADAALETLCRAYWQPLYAFVRRQGHTKEDAQDLVQDFFARLLQKQWLEAVAREKGRFRSFLLTALKRFLANEWDRQRAQKRGGGQAPLSLDTAIAERQYQAEPDPGAAADRVFERRWALTLLERTLTRLREEFTAAGKLREFDALKPFLTAGQDTASYAGVAAQLAINEVAARVAVHRLRRRFREHFRAEIAHTVAGPGDVEAEVRHLMAALGD